jgi:hypothetical protein
MALMLRMLGIPSRVSTGFSTGGRDPESNNFLVDDTDAHDWVEVFFPRIGWVTFEPTPAASPAATQLDDNALGVTKSPVPVEKSGGPGFPQTTGVDAPRPKPVASSSGAPGADGSGPDPALLLGGAAAAASLAAIVAYAYRIRRRRRLDADQLVRAELSELDRALERIGSPLPPGATLLRTQDLLNRLAGPPAASYAAALMDRRYRHPGAAPPRAPERRALRRALIAAAGRRSTLRVLWAIPPGGPIPRTERGDPRTSRRARRSRPPSAASNAAPE